VPIHEHIEVDRIEMTTQRIGQAGDVPRLDRSPHPGRE
jgi:hypothetical protein